jgi:hypothetical protein
MTIELQTKTPETIEEAVTALINIFVVKDVIVQAYNMRVEDFRGYCEHFFLRMIRDNWGLSAKAGNLYWFFRSRGVLYTNDMVAIIITSTWRRMHNIPLDLEGQTKYYVNYWMAQEIEME